MTLGWVCSSMHWLLQVVVEIKNGARKIRLTTAYKRVLTICSYCEVSEVCLSRVKRTWNSANTKHWLIYAPHSGWNMYLFNSVQQDDKPFYTTIKSITNTTVITTGGWMSDCCLTSYDTPPPQLYHGENKVILKNIMTYLTYLDTRNRDLLNCPFWIWLFWQC